MVQELWCRHIEGQAEVFSVGAGVGADAPAGIVLDVLEEDGAAFEGVGDVGEFVGGVYGFGDGDEVVGNGRLVNKFAEVHAI